MSLNLQIIKYFFKDFDEIEQFDEMVEKQLGLLFAYKRYLTVNHRNNLEKVMILINIFAKIS